MYQKPLTIEAKMDITVPGSSGLALRAWKLKLPLQDPDGPRVFQVPDGLGPGYVAVVWKGVASLKSRSGANLTSSAESTFSIFSLEDVAEIGLPEGANEVQIVVIGVVSSETEDSFLDLEPIGKCDDDYPPMPDISSGSDSLKFVVRQLHFTSDDPAPPHPDWEKWPRPGFFLTTTDGPQANSTCSPQTPTPPTGELVLTAIPPDSEITFTPGSDNAFSMAYVLDFYASGDTAPERSEVGTTPGCYIRCWGP